MFPSKYIEEVMFSPTPPRTELPPEHDMIVEDVTGLDGLNGTLRLYFDIEYLPLQPDDDFRTEPRAHLRYLDFEPTAQHRRTTRYHMDELTALTVSVLQDLADEEVECME